MNDWLTLQVEEALTLVELVVDELSGHGLASLVARFKLLGDDALDVGLEAPHLEKELAKFFGCLELLERAEDALADIAECAKLFRHLDDCLVEAQNAHDALIEAFSAAHFKTVQYFLSADVEKARG